MGDPLKSVTINSPLKGYNSEVVFMEVSKLSSSVITMLKKVMVSAVSKLLALPSSKYLGSTTDADRKTRSAPRILDAWSFIDV